jgi:mRNA interferase RelE/StbE
VLDKRAYAPRPPGCKKLVSSETPLWRVSVGDYSIFYLIDEMAEVVEMRRIGHRKEVYN